MQERLMRFEKKLGRELETELDKIDKSGTLSPDNIKLLKDAFKLKKLVKECCEDEGYSTRRGRDAMTGRYVSRDNYSGHQKMIQHLERMYDEAEDEKERQMISEWMRKAKM